MDAVQPLDESFRDDPRDLRSDSSASAVSSSPVLRLQPIKHAVDRVLAVTVVTIMALWSWMCSGRWSTRFILRDPSTFTEELAGSRRSGGTARSGLRRRPADAPGRRRAPERRSGSLESGARVVHRGLRTALRVAAAVGGGRLVWVMRRLGQTSAALQIPVGYVYLSVPICGALIAFYSVYHLLHQQMQPNQGMHNTTVLLPTVSTLIVFSRPCAAIASASGYGG